MMVGGSGPSHSGSGIQQDEAPRGKGTACELAALKKASGRDRGSESGMSHVDAS